MQEQKSPTPASTTKAFSLLELLVVIAIIGILAAASLPRFSEFRAVAYDSRAQQDLRNLAAAQELHRAGHDGYAGDLDELSAFKSSEGITLTIESSDDDAFAASSYHSSGANLFTWDSAADNPLSADPLP